MTPGAAASTAAGSANPGWGGRFVTFERSAGRLARRLATTPGRMRLASIAMVVVLLALAIVGSGAIGARQRAVNSVGGQAEPLLVGAELIYSSLADADATATNTFLNSGLEPPDRRQQYVNDLARAADQVAVVARQAGSSKDAAQALSVISKELPIYSGLIEAARANNRLGYPVGAAYLRDASSRMQGHILPAVGQLYRVQAGRLNRAYSSGRSVVDVVGMLAVAALAIVGLLLCQTFLARRTNRLLNPSLLAATLVTLVLLAWSLLALAASANRLKEAEAKGSDPVQLLSSARILVSRAQADENLALVARGSGSQYLQDFDAVTAELGPPGGGTGLLAEAAGSVPAQDPPLVGPGSPYLAYRQAHTTLVSTESTDFAQAVKLATTVQLQAASGLNSALGARIAGAQTFFDAKSAAAAHDLSGLTLGAIGLATLAAGLAFFGLHQRINEYR